MPESLPPAIELDLELQQVGLYYSFPILSGPLYLRVFPRASRNLKMPRNPQVEAVRSAHRCYLLVLTSVLPRKLLKSAERGSAVHLRILEKEWPRDTASSVRALSIVMGHFVAGLPTVHDVQLKLSEGRAEFPLSDIWDTLSLIRSSFAALTGAFKFINKEASDAQVQRMFTVIRPNVDALVTWCDFVARNSGLVFPDRPKDHGNYCSSLCLKLLLEKGAPFLVETDVLDKIIDIILWIWTFGPDLYAQKGAVMSPADYEWRASRRNGALSEALNETQPTRNMLFKKINALNRPSQIRLAKVFCCRVREWAAVHEQLYREDPSKFDGCFFTYICVLAQELAHVPSFCRALTDCKFWHLLVTTVLNFRNAPAPTSAADPERGSLATEIAFYIFKPYTFGAHDIMHIIPQSLDAGILDIFIDDLLASLTGSAERQRFSWDEECKIPGPFRQIYSISHYHMIAMAVLSAVDALPKERIVAVQSNPAAAKTYNWFISNLEDFKEGLKYSGTKKLPPICDCLDVSAPSTSCFTHLKAQ